MQTRPAFAAAIAFSAAAALTSCSHISFTPTGPAQPPRPPGCDFELLSTPPQEGYLEIGTVDAPGDGSARTATLDQFRDEIRSHVCRAGGDAVVASSNGFTYYRAAVLKRTATAPAPTAGAGAGGKPGCTTNTQCKGGRVCDRSECVDPPTKL